MRKRVFIADDDRDLTKLLAQRCRRIGLTVERARDGFQAGLGLFVTCNRKTIPKCIILDVNMPNDDGLTICEELSRDDRLAKVPVIVLTGRNDWCTIQRCRELGAHYIHKSGNVWRKLQPLLEELTAGAAARPERERSPSCDATSPACLASDTEAFPTVTVPAEEAPLALAEPEEESRLRILVVDDDHLLSEVIKRRLKQQGLDVERAFTGDDGLRKALRLRPDVIVTDCMMPEGDAAYLLRGLRNRPETADIPVIVISACDLSEHPSSNGETSLRDELLDLGAHFILRKPVDHVELATLIRRSAAPTAAPAGVP